MSLLGPDEKRTASSCFVRTTNSRSSPSAISSPSLPSSAGGVARRTRSWAIYSTDSPSLSRTSRRSAYAIARASRSRPSVVAKLLLSLDMRRSYRYKAKLSAGVEARADRVLHLLRDLYNAALEERRDHWRFAGERVTFAGQCKALTEIRRDIPEYGRLDRHSTEYVLNNLEKAFQAFFRRVRSGERRGYPRFKGRYRFNSVTFRQTGWKLDGRYLTLRAIGRIKLHLSRPIEGDVKTVTLKRDRCGDWWVTFSCDNVPARPLPDTGKAVGVDVGLAALLTTSDGEAVVNPRQLREAERDLIRAQRRVSRRKRGGYRRRKAVRVLASKHRAVRRARRDHAFKTALDRVRRYDTIAVEDLNIAGLKRSRLAKSVSDAAWGQFLHALDVKAEEAGRTVVRVDPRGTSQECAGCGHTPDTKKTLAVRTHECESCGLVLDRDHNAALNILARAGPSGSGRRRQAAAKIRQPTRSPRPSTSVVGVGRPSTPVEGGGRTGG